MRPTIFCLGILLLSGCSSTGSLTDKSPNDQWVLVRMEIDPASVKNAGTLPIYSRPNGSEFGMLPRANGLLRAVESGKLLMQVTIQEPVISYTGRGDLIEYPVVRFFGTRTPDGRRVVLADASSQNASIGTPTVLHVTDIGRGQLKIQAATGDVLLPYLYYFCLLYTSRCV